MITDNQCIACNAMFEGSKERNLCDSCVQSEVTPYYANTYTAYALHRNEVAELSSVIFKTSRRRYITS